MSNNILTDEQYRTLLEGEIYFQEFANTSYCRTIDPRYLTRMKAVHDEFFRSPLNINCGTCLGMALSKLWYHMGVKKGTLDEPKN